MTFDITNSDYASRARKAMKVAQKLRELGAQSVLDIPRIAVIGGQSAGKSSLVETISGVRVPRDAGTCTRCPMEINLINTPGHWSCTVTLRFEFDSSGNRLLETLIVPFGPVLGHVDEVELALRRAQAAILSHPMDPNSFLSKTKHELDYYRSRDAFLGGTQKFSKNCVVLDIHDEQCLNLSFVDLPGLIQNDEDEIVKLVEDLVRSNIQGNCLIIVAIPMSDDMENQRSMRLALEEDSDRSRTIGVLTKPDTLSSGAISARQKWADLLSDTETDPTFALQLGYYSVKLSDDAEREKNPSRKERSVSEATFFSTTEPWRVLPNRRRFGVANLVLDLSRHLTGILDRFLPNLLNQAQKQLTETRSALSRLPEPPQADLLSEALSLVTDFSQELSSAIYGNLSSSPNIPEYAIKIGRDLIQKNRMNYRLFKDKLLKTAPDFRPFEKYADYEKLFLNEEDRIHYDEDNAVGPFDLSFVSNVINKSVIWELPKNVPFSAKYALIDMITKSWDIPAEECFNVSVKNLNDCIKELLRVQFGRYPRFQNHIGNLVNDIVASRIEAAFTALKMNIKIEKYPVFTQNEEDLEHYRQKWLNFYTDILKNKDRYLMSKEHFKAKKTTKYSNWPPTTVDDHEKLVQEALLALRKLGYKDVLEEDFARLHSVDGFREELAVMADVRAYFTIAYKRFADVIPMMIEHTLNQELALTMKRELLQRMNISGAYTEKRFDVLMAEDPEVAQKRAGITALIGKLEKSIDELRDFVV